MSKTKLPETDLDLVDILNDKLNKIISLADMLGGAAKSIEGIKQSSLIDYGDLIEQIASSAQTMLQHWHTNKRNNSIL